MKTSDYNETNMNIIKNKINSKNVQYSLSEITNSIIPVSNFGKLVIHGLPNSVKINPEDTELICKLIEYEFNTSGFAYQLISMYNSNFSELNRFIFEIIECFLKDICRKSGQSEITYSLVYDYLWILKNYKNRFIH